MFRGPVLVRGRGFGNLWINQLIVVAPFKIKTKESWLMDLMCG